MVYLVLFRSVLSSAVLLAVLELEASVTTPDTVAVGSVGDWWDDERCEMHCFH